MRYLNRRREGEDIRQGVNWMVEPGYVALYVRWWGKSNWHLAKLRVRSKEYADKLISKKRVYFSHESHEYIDA